MDTAQALSLRLCNPEEYLEFIVWVTLQRAQESRQPLDMDRFERNHSDQEPCLQYAQVPLKIQ